MVQRSAPAARIAFVVALVTLAALSRLVPHPPNFTPIESIALFAGAALGARWLALVVPLAALLLSDLVLGLHWGMPAVYACVAAIALLGMRLGPAPRARRIAGYGLGGALLFFVITNFSTWLALGHPPMYPHTAEGLFACYVAALPFFANQLAGVACYSTLLFGAMALARRRLGAVGAAHA